MRRNALAALCGGMAALLLAIPAQAQTPLKSFSYISSGCHSKGDLLTFGGIDEYRMTETKPGAGDLPSGNYWIRAISVTFFGSSSDQWAIVGHWGPNGDWVSPPTMSGTSQFVTFAADAAPLFKAGEYLDVHAGCSKPHWWWTRPAKVIVSVWYVPAR